MIDPADTLRKATRLKSQLQRKTSPSASPLDLAAADWLQAKALLRLNRPSEAEALILPSLKIAAEMAPGSSLHCELTISRGTVEMMTGNIQGALRDYQRAYGIFQIARDTLGQGGALLDITVIYLEADDFRSILKYTQQILGLGVTDPGLLLSVYNHRAIAFSELGQYKAASLQYRNAIKEAKAMHSPRLETQILYNLAIDQAKSGDLAGADASLTKAFALSSIASAAGWRPALLKDAADLALRRNQFDRAKQLIERALAEMQIQQGQAQLPVRDFHQTAYQVFRATGDDAAALAHLEAFKKLDDESRTLAASTNAALMAARFDFANQDLKISRLQVSQARAQARFRETVTAGLLTAAGVISTLLAIGFVSIRRSRNQVRAANATLTTTNADLAKALAAKSEFLATTSHEIRTPLNGILGMTQVILADRALPDPLRNRVELVHGAGETMRALVDDILDVAKMETGELRLHPSEMNLRRLLEDAATVWTGQAETKRIGITLDIADCPGGIVADEVRLRQVVFNLMSNAIKFTDKGAVALTAHAAPAQDGAGERLVIAVRDTGIGIPPDRVEDIFESFRQVDGGTTRRHGGTGLGLAICRTLARAMGGDVTVASTLGTGSTFTLDLPLARADLPAAPAQAERVAVATLADAELLLLEANPLAQGIMRALITPKVRALRVVAQPDEAFEALAGGNVDHLVADGATIGLDPDVAERLAAAAAAAHARLTMLWPSPSRETVTLLETKGIKQLLAKPLAAPDLLAALQMVYDPSVASHDIAA